MAPSQNEQVEPLLTEEKPQHQDNTLDLHFKQYIDHRRKQLLARLLHSLRPPQIVRLAKRLGYVFTPTLIRSLVWDEHAAPPKKFPTSYLNGLRGVTAVKVFTFHYTFAYSDTGFQPWGVDERHKHFLELPIIRYFYSGFTSHVFFGIAGYLTSLRLFQLLDKNDAANHSKVLQNVSGSLFRRALRLYLPVFIITLVTTSYVHYGFFETNRPLIADHENLFPGDWNEPKPNMAPTWYPQLHHWFREMFALTNIVMEATVYPYHDQHLWSIQAEMRASLHLYGILLAVALCKPHIRIIIMLFLTYMYFLWNHWEIWVYILGAVVAQLDLILTAKDKAERESLDPLYDPKATTAAPLLHHPQPNGHVQLHDLQPNGHTSPPTPLPTPPPRPQISRPTHEFPYLPSQPFKHYTPYLRTLIRYLSFLLAFYFLSYPIDGSRDYAPGYILLNRAIPDWMARKDKFYPNIGTAILLLLLARSDPATSRWRRVLTSRIPQYLGSISFALYLVHGPIMHAAGYLVPHKIAWMLHTELRNMGDWGWAGTIMVGWAFTLFLSLWAADVWTREVEGRCVKVVKDLERVCFVGKGD